MYISIAYRIYNIYIYTIQAKRFRKNKTLLRPSAEMETAEMFSKVCVGEKERKRERERERKRDRE